MVDTAVFPGDATEVTATMVFNLAIFVELSL